MTARANPEQSIVRDQALRCRARAVEGAFRMSLARVKTTILVVLVAVAAASACGSPTPSPQSARAPAESASGSAVVDPLPSWNDGESKAAILGFVHRVTTEGGADFVPMPSTHRHVRQRRHVVGRATDLRPAGLCARSESRCWPHNIRTGTTKQPFKAVLEGDVKAVVAERRTWPRRDSGGDPHRDDDGRVRSHRHLLDCIGPTSDVRPTLHRDGVYQPMLEVLALPARQRVQDLHRVWRRRGVHAAVDRTRVRHPAGAGHRQPGIGAVSAPGAGFRAASAS